MMSGWNWPICKKKKRKKSDCGNKALPHGWITYLHSVPACFEIPVLIWNWDYKSISTTGD